jgi:NADH-quinone oxidoreductase E subunit
MEGRVQFSVPAPAPTGEVRHRLSDAALAEIERLALRYATREALMLPALWLLQDEHGWISESGMAHVAEVLGVSPVRVYSVVTFYHMFHAAPPGRYNVQVCHNLSCSLLGAEKLIEGLHRRFGVETNEPTPDGRFMIQRVECLGACEHAPCIQINADFHFKLTPAKLDQILDALP